MVVIHNVNSPNTSYRVSSRAHWSAPWWIPLPMITQIFITFIIFIHCQWWCSYCRVVVGVMRPSYDFYSRLIMAFGYCRIACDCLFMCPPRAVHPSFPLCVNPQIVRAITYHLLKPEPPNLDQKCKSPLLRFLLFRGFIDLELQGQF